jgi:CelD/BcsL family acetyltransferase involved in cellulose biosynthesis
VVKLVGDGPADRLAPICAPADRPAAAAALHDAVRELRADLLVADAVPAEEGWEGLLGARVLRREANPVLATEGRSWDEFLASRSRNFREQVRRRERKLGREHELNVRLCDDADRLEDDMHTLFALHDARWGGEADTFGGPRAAFHLDFARAALDRGWLRLWVLELDGEPAAAWYGFRYAGAEWYYQMGRDPRRDRQSVGFVLLCHTMRDAFDAGVSEYRLLRGDEEYKDRFATHDHGLATIAVARTARGRAATAASAGVRRLPPGARQRLVRLTG